MKPHNRIQKMKVVILGTAHLESTPGKRSPDGKFREYKYSREIIEDIKTKLESYGYLVLVDVPQDDLKGYDQNKELSYRVQKVNNWCKTYGVKNCIYVSVHVNAAGSDGKWHTATGWEAYTTKGVTKADKLAECLYSAAKQNLTGQKIRTDKSDGDSDQEANFYVIRKTNCPAVLTENFFQDNKKDVDYMLSEQGRHEIVRTHVEGILKYINE